MEFSNEEEKKETKDKRELSTQKERKEVKEKKKKFCRGCKEECDRYFRVILNEQETTDLPDEQFFACNGYSFRIKRGMEVPLPFGAVDVIKNAIYLVEVKDKDGARIGERRIPRFSYSILGEINQGDG